MTGNRRVIIVHYSELIPTDNGFEGSRYQELSDYCTERKVDVIRVAPSFIHRSRQQRQETGWLKYESEVSYYVIPTRGYKNPRSLNRIMFLKDFRDGVVEFLARNPADLVIFGVPQPGLAHASKDVLHERTKIVLDIRDTWPDTQIATSQGWKKLAISLFGKKLLRDTKKDLWITDGVVSISKSYQRWVLQHSVNPDKNTAYAVFPLGSPDLHAALKTNKKIDRKGLVYVGSLSPVVNLEVAIKAWLDIEKRYPDLAEYHRFKIAGRGSEFERLKKLANGSEYIDFLGYVPQAEARDLMLNSALGIACYSNGDFHTLPNKFFDYMSCGLPILTNLSGEAQDLVKKLDIGLTMDTDDSSTWAEEIHEYLVASEIVRDKTENCIAARDSFDRKKIAADYGNFLFELLEMKKVNSGGVK